MIDEAETIDPRAEIAARNRRRQLEARARKFTGAVFGLMGYSAFANIVASALAIAETPGESVFGVFLGVLYAFGANRVRAKDETRWWPVAVPAGLSIAALVLAAIGGFYNPIAF